MDNCNSLIDKIHSITCEDIHFATPISSLRANEVDLVRGILQILQGYSSSLFYWNNTGQHFYVGVGIHVTHLSQTSLHAVLNKFMYAATSLKLVEDKVNKLHSLRLPHPTLKAFGSSVSAWLERLRDIALKEEVKISSSCHRNSPTLLGLANSLSSLCSGAELLLKIVNEAILEVYFEPNASIPASELAVHILDYLYVKLNEVSLVPDGEEKAFRMLLYIFVGSLLPYIEGLDSWLYEGTLDDPYEEMYFYANKSIAIDEPDFWEKSYVMRDLKPNVDSETMTKVKKEMNGKESISTKGREQTNLCPLFIKHTAKAIISAGKSLQLIGHLPNTFPTVFKRKNDHGIVGSGSYHGCNKLDTIHLKQRMTGLTLSEVFFISLASLIGDNDHISKFLCEEDPFDKKSKMEEGNDEKIWVKFLVNTRSHKRELNSESNSFKEELSLLKTLCLSNPVLTVCQTVLEKERETWDSLNIFRSFHLPPLGDEGLREAILGGNVPDVPNKGSDYVFGFHFSEVEYHRSRDETKTLEGLFPFPTILPSIQENFRVSELLPFQKNSSLSSKVLDWIKDGEPKATPLPFVIMQECLIVYIKKQVDYIGSHILTKLMNDWNLMDELGVLRAIYLLGSGDLLQHFLTVIFNKLDGGETWDDEFELNTILQESIRNSADGMLLTAPDLLVVSITRHHGFNEDDQHFVSTPRRNRDHTFGINSLDLLKFTYKVSWPLELIANTDAIRKYNQVMCFLLKVKRAKFVLDKARRWMWKGRGNPTINRKRHWLVEQKLLHFVDAFHQYVMDRVYHSAWRDLCEGMESAKSLDEVIEVHEAYLLSIQRQCFVVPDKLWALIASRINSILGLALDFYSIQQTLSSGGTVSIVKARCQMEVDRIEKQFDECVSFLLRVLSFKLNVGQFPHLADLVTRINYNCFYMSDGATGSENAASRTGKSFPSRAD